MKVFISIATLNNNDLTQAITDIKQYLVTRNKALEEDKLNWIVSIIESFTDGATAKFFNERGLDNFQKRLMHVGLFHAIDNNKIEEVNCILKFAKQ